MPRSLLELALVFLKLGALSFGGPAAHVALMEEEIVRRRGWLTPGEFLDLLGAVNLIPGPNSTEMALHVGRVRHGLPGLVVAGLATIAPAFLCVLALARAHVVFGARPEAAGVLDGIKPVMAAIVVQALVRLAGTAWRRRRSLAVGLTALAVSLLFEGHDLAVVIGAGSILAAVEGRGRAAPFLLAAAPVATASAVPTPAGLFLVFLKIGGTLFGSGYVLLSYMRADLVTRLGWLTEGQLLDAVAAGQITPGPLFTSATFVGYLLAGVPGAVAATAGIFLPAFLLVAASGPLVPRLRASKTASAFLDGANAASVALMAAVSLRLSAGILTDGVSAATFVVSLACLWRTRIGSPALMAAGAAVGLLRSAI